MEEQQRDTIAHRVAREHPIHMEEQQRNTIGKNLMVYTDECIQCTQQLTEARQDPAQRQEQQQRDLQRQRSKI